MFVSILGDTKSVQQMRVSGQCSDLKFEVEFELSEVKVGKDAG